LKTLIFTDIYESSDGGKRFFFSLAGDHLGNKGDVPGNSSVELETALARSAHKSGAVHSG